MGQVRDEWDVSSVGVNGVLKKTGDEARGFQEATQTYVSGLENGAVSSGSQIVAAAITGFAEFNAPVLRSVVERVSRVLTGTVTATTAYLEGDLDMALEAQRSASG